MGGLSRPSGRRQVAEHQHLRQARVPAAKKYLIHVIRSTRFLSYALTDNPCGGVFGLRL